MCSLCDRYDARIKSWTKIPSIPGPKRECTVAAATRHGRLALIGGWDGYRSLKNVTIYDVRAARWDEGKALNVPRNRPFAVTVNEKFDPK